jgi:hypothetical protein
MKDVHGANTATRSATEHHERRAIGQIWRRLVMSQERSRSQIWTGLLESGASGTSISDSISIANHAVQWVDFDA